MSWPFVVFTDVSLTLPPCGVFAYLLPMKRATCQGVKEARKESHG